MRLIAYDFEALVRVAQQAPWRDGLAEVRAWLEDVKSAERAETGFAHDVGEERRFDPALVDTTVERLEAVHERLGGDRPLRELVGDFPGKVIGPTGYDGWALYEDLVRTWSSLVSLRWSEAHLLAADGAASLLGPLGTAIGRDLRLAPYSPACTNIGKPYPTPWRAKPRARIYHVTTEYLDWLGEIGNSDVERAAPVARRTPEEISATVGRLIRHFELARQLDTVVAVDPDDSFWT